MYFLKCYFHVILSSSHVGGPACCKILRSMVLKCTEPEIFLHTNGLILREMVTKSSLNCCF